MNQRLDLLNKERSTIDYTITTFPDGEKHIVLGEINHKHMVSVICRIANADDLFILSQIGDILNRRGLEFTITITYLMGARMDRVISFNEAFSLKLVAEIINSMKPVLVDLIEPHSLRAVKLINNCRYSLVNITSNKADCYCLPDAGAMERYEPQLTQIPNEIKPVLLFGQKVRDPKTGKLTGFKISNPQDYKGGSICVVDDLCDGGGTFAGIAKEIRKFAPDAHLKIYVTHMVNPKGITTLSENYDEVTFSDSYKDWSTESLPENVKFQKTWTK